MPRVLPAYFLQVLNNEPEPCTFNTAEMACWEIYKKVLEVGDKYDMPVVRERYVSVCARACVCVVCERTFLCPCRQVGTLCSMCMCAYVATF